MSIESNSTTTFIDEVSENVKFVHTPEVARVELHEASIRAFLEKPQRIHTGTWTDLQAANTTLFSFNTDEFLQSNPFWFSKLQGYALIRSTMVVRITINANPFQQGRLLLSFLPMETAMAAVGASYASIHTFSLVQKTQLPNMEMDSQDGTSLFAIPYITPTEFFALSNYNSAASYARGRCRLDVLSPLATGTGDSTAEFSIYIHFEDVELAVPVPQSGGTKFRYHKAKRMRDPEQVSANAPISSGLSMMSSVASSLTSIPMLEAYARPLSWACDVASGLASSLGYSKPVVEISVQPVVTQTNRYSSNWDGPDAAVVLAGCHANKIRITDSVSHTDEDEMALNYLLSKPYYNNLWIMSGSNVSGDLLYSQTIAPALLFTPGSVTRGTNTMNFRSGGPLYYLSNVFQLYRGSIKVTFKFVKTAYHTGRIAITYVPGTTSLTSPTLDGAQLALREIVDLSEVSELTMTLPYLLPNLYVDKDASMGLLSVRVLNGLREPDTAANVITALVYYSAGDDFEYQYPGGSVIPLVASPESGKEVYMGGEVPAARSLEPSELCVGESISSIKQILLRYTRLFTKSAVFGTNGFKYWPFHMSVTAVTSTDPFRSSVIGGDLLSFLGSMYVFTRGSVRVSTLGQNSEICLASDIAVGGNIITPISSTINPFTPNGAVTWSTPGTLNGVFNNGLNINFAGQVPYHSPMRVSLNVPSVLDIVPNDNSISTTGLLTTSGNPRIARAVADDFQLSYFVGCPPVRV